MKTLTIIKTVLKSLLKGIQNFLDRLFSCDGMAIEQLVFFAFLSFVIACEIKIAILTHFFSR